MIWGREIENPDEIKMTKPDPEIVFSQDWINLTGKMVIQGREIENPNNIEIWKEMTKPDPEFTIYQHGVHAIGK